MKALVGAFNQEKALVGAFSAIVQLRRLIVCNTNPVQALGDGGRLVGEDLLGQVARPYWDYSSLSEAMK